MKTEASPYQILGSSGDFSRGTVTVDVTNALRQAIVSLALPPGTSLDKSAICTGLAKRRDRSMVVGSVCRVVSQSRH